MIGARDDLGGEGEGEGEAVNSQNCILPQNLFHTTRRACVLCVHARLTGWEGQAVKKQSPTSKLRKNERRFRQSGRRWSHTSSRADSSVSKPSTIITSSIWQTHARAKKKTRQEKTAFKENRVLKKKGGSRQSKKWRTSKKNFSSSLFPVGVFFLSSPLFFGYKVLVYRNLHGERPPPLSLSRESPPPNSSELFPKFSYSGVSHYKSQAPSNIATL